MEHPPLLSEARWARDFALVGVTVGALAPFFVIFDPGFAALSGLAGGASGALVGTASAWSLERVRGRVPLAIIVPLMAIVGSLWGAFAGACGGVGSIGIGIDAVPLGFVLGATTGMVTLGVGFLPYLMVSVRGSSTLPVVALGVLASPTLGWAGLMALGAATFGMWLFALPFLALAGVALDRSERAVRCRRTPRREAPQPTASVQETTWASARPRAMYCPVGAGSTPPP